MRRLFTFSIRNPMFVNLLTAFVVVAGVMALKRLNTDMFPNINLDIVVVTTVYPGATPQEIEKLITIPIEKELKEVSDIKEMTSASIEGRCTIVLEIEPDAPDKAKTVNDIQRAVDRAKDLPLDLEDDPYVYEVQMRDHPVVEVSMSGDLPEGELVEQARILETKMLDTPGIASVARSGWRDREIWVEVDPHKVGSMRFSLADVMIALMKRNVSVPGGSVIISEKEKMLRTTGAFDSASEVEKVVLRANELGHWVQISDVAKVSDEFEPVEEILKTDGNRAINLVAIKKESGDVIQVVDELKKMVDEYRKVAPPGLKINLVNDFSYYVKRRLDVLISNGWVGVILVLICLFMFLSTRGAIVTAIGIPIAFLMTFMVMYYSGITINLLTMFGLIMVLGMIVDDAIIISENVHRHIGEGMSPEDAALQGTSEIWRPVVSTVLTTIAAFAPLMFMGGIIGKFILYIPLIVIIALFSSLLQAFVVLPSHLVTAERLPRTPLTDRLKSGLFDKKFKRFAERYIGFLNLFLQHRKKVVGIAFSFFIVSAMIGIFVIPYVLFPQRGIDMFFVRAKAPIGTPVEEMGRRTERLERIVAEIPKSEIDNFITHVGIIQQDPNDPFTERASHVAQIHVLLKPQTDRGMTTDELIEVLREKSKGIKGFTEISFDKVRAGPPVGKPVEIRLRSDSLQELDELADVVKDYLRGIPGVSDIRDNYEQGKDEIRVVVNEQDASKADLSVEDVALAVRTAFEGAIATTIKKADEEIDVRVRYPDEWRYREGALDRVMIPNPKGNLVPIDAVATFKEGPGINAILHYDRKRCVTINANVDERRATSVGVTELVKKKFAGISNDHPGVTLGFGGEWEKTEESMRDLKMAIMVAVLIIFIILAFQFRSLMQPLVVMLAVPYGFVGVIWAFLFHGEPKSFLALMGAVGLAGVVVNNSIVLIDFINKAKEEGAGNIDAIVAAARLRLRPILLTTVTTILGLLPVAYGLMGSDPFLRPMALAIGWGLSFATVCTLLVTPCLYATIEDARDRLHRHLEFRRNNRKNSKARL